MKTIYNEKQNKHSEMIKDLQNLPKIETPENFEYNLMTRIKNKNFGNVEKDKPVFNWVRFLAPFGCRGYYNHSTFHFSSIITAD